MPRATVYTVCQLMEAIMTDLLYFSVLIQEAGAFPIRPECPALTPACTFTSPTMS